MEIIVRSISLANSPALTESELGSRAKIWGEELVEIVPASYLSDAFHRAVKDHDSTFPVSMYEVKIGYTAVATEERLKRAAEKRQRALSETAENSPDFIECRSCFGTGFAIERRPDAWGNVYDNAVRINDCRCGYWQRRAERITEHRKIDKG